MVFAYISVNYCRDKDYPPNPTQQTAKALLSSLIADGDVITDWFYYFEILQSSSQESIPQWLLIVQLVSCICGTLSWLAVSTDGRALDWMRKVIYALIWISMQLLYIYIFFIFHFCGFLFDLVTCFQCNGRKLLTNDSDDDRKEDSRRLVDRMRRKLPFTSGTLLLFGIIVEDVPQLVVTFLIEDKIRSDNPNGPISSAALVNLLFAAFDILHKLAEAWDLRKDMHNIPFHAKRSIWAHDDYVRSLINTTSNNIVSTSLDGTVKMWDPVRGKLIRKFKCGCTSVLDAKVVGTSKVLTACWDSTLKVFDYASKKKEKEIDLGFIPYSISLLPDETSFLISGFYESESESESESICIQQRTLNATDETPYNVVFEYKRPASSLVFLTKDCFVSRCFRSKEMHIWKLNQDEPIQTIQLEHEACSYVNVASLSVSPTSFLSVDGKAIKLWTASNAEWSCSKTFSGHGDEALTLAKVNNALFVSTARDGTVKLWNIEEGSCLFTFKGHGSYSVSSCVYLDGEEAVATGDYGYIKVWSISKYLKDSEDDKFEEEVP